MTAPTSSATESVPTKLGEKVPVVQSTVGDGALQLLAEAGSVGVVDPETSRRLLRKIDLYVTVLKSV